jgi:hypothetical protein
MICFSRQKIRFEVDSHRNKEQRGGMRVDISPYLVHFTKESERGSAFDILARILRERRLLGNNRYIRSGTKCICFSEAPLRSLEYGLVNANGFSRYSPYGVRLQKKWLFGLGARPVIYQPESEFQQLPPTHKWRHVRLDLENSIDFTWEREWRIECAELPFTDQDIEVVVPDEQARERFIGWAERESFFDAWHLTVVLGDQAWAYDEGNPWKIVPLTASKGAR